MTYVATGYGCCNSKSYAFNSSAVGWIVPNARTSGQTVKGAATKVNFNGAGLADRFKDGGIIGR